MYSAKVKIDRASGLHASEATEFVYIATGFESDITVRKPEGEYAANAKSLVMLLSLGLDKGMTVEISAEGPDEKQAVESLAEFAGSLDGKS